MKRLAIIILLLVFGCTSTQYNLIPLAYKQKARKFYSDGKDIIICEGRNADLILFGSRNKSEIYIYTCIINKTDNENLEIIPSQIEAFGLNKNKKLMQLKIYSVQEYINKKRNEKKWAHFLVVLCDAKNSMNALISKSYPSGYSKVNGDLDNSNFYGNEYKKSIIVTFDYSKHLEAQGRKKQELNSKYRMENQLYNSILLKNNTIPPKQYTEGIFTVMGKNSYHEKYLIIFPIGFEKYKIILNPAIVSK